MEKNFYESAVRHWLDGKILEEKEEYDNAVCMQGFAAECALKEILQQGFTEKVVNRYWNNVEAVQQDLVMLMTNDNETLSILDPACGLRLSKICLPRILFENHPDRRYFPDEKYSGEDAQICRESAEMLLKEMFNLYIDGYIHNQEGN